MPAEKVPTVEAKKVHTNKRREKPKPAVAEAKEHPTAKPEVLDKALPVDKSVAVDKKTENKQPDKDRIRANEKKVFNAAVVNTTKLVEAQAMDIGDHRMTESKEDRNAGWFKKTLTRIWKHNLFQEYYRQKEIAKAKGEILGSKNLYKGEEGDTGAAHKEAMGAIVDRFTSKYEEDVLRKEEKESKKKADTFVEGQVKNLIKEYAANPHMSKEAFEEAKNRILHIDTSKEMYADNLGKIAEEIRDAVAHGEKLNELDFDLNLTLGEARESLQTEKQRHTFDKVMNVAGKTAVGQALVNVGAMGLIAGAYSVGKYLGTSVGKKAAKWFGFGAGALAAGGIEAAKEAARIKRDRYQHIRESAKGMKFTEEDMKRRQEMNKNLYEMRSARDISNQMEADIARIESGRLSETDLQNVVKNLADLEARIRIGDQRKIDLVSFSSFSRVERERTDLDLARARLKVALNRGIQNKTIQYTQSAEFKDYLASAINVNERDLLGGEKGVEAKDKIFNKLKRKSIAKAFVKGTLISAGVGIALQEVTSVLHADTDNALSGMLKHARDNWTGHGAVNETLNAHSGPLDHNATALEAFRRWAMGDSPRLPFGTGHEMLLDKDLHSHLQMPDGVQAVQSATGEGSDIIRNGEVIAHNVCLDVDQKTGDLLEETKKILAEYDIHTNMVTTGTHEEHVIPAHDWVEKNIKGLHHIARQWMGNDTPMYEDPDHPGHLLGADQNELRTHWLGQNHTGIAENGHYQLTVQHMTNDGSYQDGVSVAAADERGAGALKALLSVTKDSQHYVIEVPISKEGLIDIDPNSTEGKMLFENVNGHAVYTGAFLEIAKPNGVTADGREIMQVLGTHIGTDHAHDGVEIVDTIRHDIKMDVPDDWDYDTPYPVPLVPRTPLERGKPGEPRPIPIIEKTKDKDGNPYPVYYGMNSAEGLKEEMERNGVTPDPYFKKIKGGKEVWINKNGDPIVRNAERERARIQKYLDSQDKAYLAELKKYMGAMGPMKEKCRVAVTIPARFEEKNLGNLLDQYSKQTDAAGNEISKDLFEINIIVNRKEGEKADRSVEIIEEWKKNHPGYNVNVMDVVFPKEKANVGMCRKYITDLTLMRSLARPKSDGPLYLESEDADLFAIDKRTVSKLINDFDAKPYVDVLRGIQDRQPEVMQKNDLLFFDRRLWDIMEVFMRKEAYRPENMKGSSFVWNRVISGGWNTAYTAEAYAQIGGYVSDVIGEDMKIGQKISLLRGHEGKNGEIIANTSTAETSGLRSNSSPRRFIDAMVRKISPYDDFENQSLKEKSLDELMEGIKEFAKISEGQKGAYEDAINRLGSFLAEQMSDSTEATTVLRRTLNIMGLKENTHYVFKGNALVEFKDNAMSRISSVLERYKTEKRHEWGYRRQNHPLVFGGKAPATPTEGTTKSKPEDLLTGSAGGTGSTEAATATGTTPEVSPAGVGTTEPEKVEAAPTPATAESGVKLRSDADTILSFMNETVGGLEVDIESRLKLYTETAKRSERPAVVVFETDPNRRDAVMAVIEKMRKRFPVAQIEYVPLPDDKSELKNMTKEEYMKAQLAKLRGEAGIPDGINQGTIPGGDSPLFKPAA